MELEKIVGKKIVKIFMCEEFIQFVTDKGNFTYEVTGECCSYSYMYDIYGVKNILGKIVTGVKEVELKEGDRSFAKEHNNPDCLKCYGFQIFANDPEFGEMTCAFSFRNDSNGYYGGYISEVNDPGFTSNKFIEVTEDIVDITKLTK